MDELRKRGIRDERIISYRFDSMEYEDMTAKQLYEMIKTKLSDTEKTYLFLDEVQEITSWEKTVNSINTDFDVDIYVTGSNSRMMSSEIATYLTCIGKTPNGEIDFIATRQNDKLYIQITKEIKSEKTEKREYDRLLEVGDNYPKYLLTADDFAGGNYQGIKTMHVTTLILLDSF